MQRSLYLIVIIAVGHFVIDLMLSVWPVFKTMAHLDIAVAGVVYAISVVICEFLQIVFGKFIDRGYQKELFIIGILLGSLPAFYPYVGSWPLFFALLLAVGVGSAAFHPTAAAVLGEYESHRKTGMLGIFQMAGNLGMGFGQLLFTASYEFFHGHTVLLIVPGVVLATYVFFSDILTRPRLEHPQTISLRYTLKFFSSQPLRYLYCAQLFSQVILWSVVFLLPDFLEGRGYGEWMAFGGGNFAYFLGAALGCLPVGHLKNRFSSSKVIVWNFFGAIICYYLLLFLPFPNPTIACILLFCIGAFLGGIMPLCLALGSDFVPHRRGMVSACLMGLVWIVSEGGGIGGISLLTLCFATDGPRLSLAIFGLFLFVGAFFAAKLIRYEKEKFTLPA